MSQRVQKGNTVFRPVARSRARVGTESRQTSVLADSTPAAGSSRMQECLGAPSTMPPHSVPQSIPAETTSANAPFAQDFPPLNELLPIPSAIAPTGGSSFPQASLRTVRGVPTRLAPVIRSSRQPSSHAPTPFSGPSQPPPREPLPQDATFSNPTVAAPPEACVPSGLAVVPTQMPGMHDHFPTLPFPIGSMQIDPQLMDPQGTTGIHTSGSEGVPLHESSFDNRPLMALNDVPAVKASRPRRASRKRSGADNINTEEMAEHGNAESTTLSAGKRRSQKADTGGDENTADSARKKRRTPGAGRARTRPPSAPPFDPDIDPGEELDPTVITMANLCDDIGRGRVSSRAAQIVSNHAAWRAVNREKRARMKQVMEAKKHGRNLEEEEEGARSNAPDPPQVEISRSGSVVGTPAGDRHETNAPSEENMGDKDADGFNYGENLMVSQYNPQVRIGANGETIIDEDSLFVSRNEEHHTEDYAHVEESDFTKFVNSATYSKKARGSRWSAEETELFYDALSQFGENYELISYVLPGRDRKACKNKFKIEDKKNSARITYCLSNRRPYDIATLSRMTGKDFSGPTPEIRAPTPHRSEELQNITPIPTPQAQVVRKKSRTPIGHDSGVEIVGDIDDVREEDSGGDPSTFSGLFLPP